MRYRYATPAQIGDELIPQILLAEVVSQEIVPTVL